MQREEKVNEILLIQRFLEELLDSVIAPATYTVINFHIRKSYGKSLEELIWEDPKKTYNAVVMIIGGGELQGRLLRETLTRHLENFLGRSIDGEFYQAVMTNDAEKVRKCVVKLAREYLRKRLEKSTRSL